MAYSLPKKIQAMKAPRKNIFIIINIIIILIIIKFNV